MLSRDVIEHAQTISAPLIVFVPKKDGFLDICAGYWKFNAVQIWDSSPTMLMDKCINMLGETTIFSILPMPRREYKAQIAKGDSRKTTFSSHVCLFRFKSMPSGLKNDPGTFQAVEVLFKKGKGQFALVFLDDIVIFLRTPDEHIDHVQQVVTLLSMQEWN